LTWPCRGATLVTVALTAVVAFLVGAIARRLRPSRRLGRHAPKPAPPQMGAHQQHARRRWRRSSTSPTWSALNAAVVNIDRPEGRFTEAGGGARPSDPGQFDGPFDFGTPREMIPPRRGTSGPTSILTAASSPTTTSSTGGADT
jgi:hypothetical protein